MYVLYHVDVNVGRERLEVQAREATRTHDALVQRQEASTQQYERELAEERSARAKEVGALTQKVAWHVHNQVKFYLR